MERRHNIGWEVAVWRWSHQPTVVTTSDFLRVLAKAQGCGIGQATTSSGKLDS